MNLVRFALLRNARSQLICYDIKHINNINENIKISKILKINNNYNNNYN